MIIQTLQHILLNINIVHEFFEEKIQFENNISINCALFTEQLQRYSNILFEIQRTAFYFYESLIFLLFDSILNNDT